MIVIQRLAVLKAEADFAAKRRLSQTGSMIVREAPALIEQLPDGQTFGGLDEDWGISVAC